MRQSFLSKVIDKAISSGRNSWDGFLYLFKSELASRIEVYAFFWTIGLFWLVGASVKSMLIGAALFLLLLAIEALNTAVEVIIDRISPEISDTGKRAKDLGSFAVFCGLAICGGYVIYVIATSPKVSGFWG